MALQTKNFSVTKKSAGGGITYTFTIRVTENSINKEKNTSNLTVKAILQQSYSGTAFYSWSTGVSCSLDGNQIFSDYAKRSLSGTSEQAYYTWTGDVSHKADGTLTLPVSGKFWQSSYESYSPPAMSVSGSMTLTNIPRSSAVTASDANIGSVTAIAIADQGNFTHSLAYSFGDLTGYVTPDGVSDTEVKFSEKTLYWTVPIAFYYEIPDKKWAKCKLTCRTYSGDVQVGEESTTTFLATAAEANCAPTITGWVRDINEETLALTGDEHTLIRYHSTVQCDVESQAYCGAEVTSDRVNGSLIVNNVKRIEDVEIDTFHFVARDTREWYGYHDVTLPMIPYTRLTCNPTARRLAPGEDTVEVTLTGKMYVGNFGVMDNALTVTCQVNSRNPIEVEVAVDETGAYHTTVLLEIDYATNNTLTVVAKDLLDRVSVKLPVQKGIPVFHWGENDFVFHVPVHCEQAVSGVYTRTVRVWNAERKFQLQSRFVQWDTEGGKRQSVLLFGSRDGTPVLGTLVIRSNGTFSWQGAPAVTATALENGAVEIDLGGGAYDMFVLVSADPFAVI